MRLLLLGTGGFHPSESRHTACLLLPELGVLLDAGTGAFRVQQHIETDRLDVYLTHAHLDHVVGLTYLLGLEHDGREVESVVHAAPGVVAAVRDHLLQPALFPIAPVKRFVGLEARQPLHAGGELLTFPLDHPGGAHGMRIEAAGKSIAYVSDTTRLTPAGVEAIRGVDLLVHEAYFTQPQREFAQLTGHSTAADAAWAAREAGVGRLVMVHRDPRAAGDLAEPLAEARRVFSGAEFAEDGLEVVL